MKAIPVSQSEREGDVAKSTQNPLRDSRAPRLCGYTPHPCSELHPRTGTRLDQPHLPTDVGALTSAGGPRMLSEVTSRSSVFLEQNLSTQKTSMGVVSL